MRLDGGQIKCSRCGVIRPQRDYSPSIAARGCGYCRDCAQERERGLRAADPAARERLEEKSLRDAARASGLVWCGRCRNGKPPEDFHRSDRLRGTGWCRECRSERKRAEYAADPSAVLARNRAYRQAKPEKYRAAEANHDHATGAVRGLLCHRCNTGIGMLGDTAEGVERALAYLVSSSGTFTQQDGSTVHRLRSDLN